MKHTAFSVPAANLDRFATSYLTDPDSDALTLYDAPEGQWSAAPVFPSGGAGLVSTGAPVGQYGWDGGLGTIWRNDPSEQLTAILMTNAAWSSPRPPGIALDFLTAAYAAIDDETNG